jgi:hypothetical protein
MAPAMGEKKFMTYKNYALKSGLVITPYHFGAVAIAKETVDGR